MARIVRFSDIEKARDEGGLADIDGAEVFVLKSRAWLQLDPSDGQIRPATEPQPGWNLPLTGRMLVPGVFYFTRFLRVTAGRAHPLYLLVGSANGPNCAWREFTYCKIPRNYALGFLVKSGLTDEIIARLPDDLRAELVGELAPPSAPDLPAGTEPGAGQECGPHPTMPARPAVESGTEAAPSQETAPRPAWDAKTRTLSFGGFTWTYDRNNASKQFEVLNALAAADWTRDFIETPFRPDRDGEVLDQTCKSLKRKLGKQSPLTFKREGRRVRWYPNAD